MSESNLRDALLNQNGPVNLEFELKMLNSLIELETRRTRRLLIWTIVVALLWLVDVVAMFGGYMLFAQSAIQAQQVANQPAQQQRADQQPQPQQQAADSHSTFEIIMMIAVILGFAGLFGLPIVGLVLLVMLGLSPRSNQLRASLAAIDAQLRTLSAAQRPPANPTATSS